jgi:adenylosuccinate lyase
MPLPERYAEQVPDMHAIWAPEGYFKAQTRIWEAECEAYSELTGKPTPDQMGLIRQALILNQEDIQFLNVAQGHETNKLLRRVQSRLPTEVGNFIHKGNTSSDVLDTSLAMQIQQSLKIVENDTFDLGMALSSLGIAHKDTLQIARSHGQHAVPHTFGRQVIGWYAEVSRGMDRIDMAGKMIAFGKLSGEVGTNINISPEIEELALGKLGLEPDPAPSQVISRDRHATVLSLMAVNAGTLERISTNIRSLSRTEIGEVREPFEDQEGSSAMPHKRNPELSERISGLSRVIRGDESAELSSQALWDERDISHSSVERFTFPDVFGGLSYSARLATRVIKGLVVNKEKMAENVEITHGAIYSPGLLNELMAKGKSRTEAYELVKDLAQRAIDQKIPLQDLASQNPVIANSLNSDELAALFNHQTYLKNIDVAFKRLGLGN